MKPVTYMDLIYATDDTSYLNLQQVGTGHIYVVLTGVFMPRSITTDILE